MNHYITYAHCKQTNKKSSFFNEIAVFIALADVDCLCFGVWVIAVHTEQNVHSTSTIDISIEINNEKKSENAMRTK